MHDVVDHRVAVVLAPGVAAVGGDGQALNEPGRPGGVARRIDGDHRGRTRTAQPGGVFVIHDGAARGHGAQLIGVQGHRQLGPVHQVAADGVAPVQVAPLDAVGIVLVEQVVLAPEAKQAVRVVVPAAPRGEVELRAQMLAVQLVRRHRLRRQLQPVQRRRAGALELHGEALPEERLQVAEHLVVPGPVRQVDVEVAHHLAAGAQPHMPVGLAPRAGGRPPAHRQDQVAPVYLQLAAQQSKITSFSSSIAVWETKRRSASVLCDCKLNDRLDRCADSDRIFRIDSGE